MGSVVWSMKCSECGAEGGWTYSFGVITDHVSKEAFGVRGDKWTPLICKDCGTNSALPPQESVGILRALGGLVLRAVGLRRRGAPRYEVCPVCVGSREHPGRLGETPIACPRCRHRSFRTSTEYIR